MVGLIDKTQTDEQAREYLDELAFLAETAGAVTMKRFTQKLQHPDSKTFVGKGKLEEIKTYITLKDVQLASQSLVAIRISAIWRSWPLHSKLRAVSVSISSRMYFTNECSSVPGEKIRSTDR